MYIVGERKVMKKQILLFLSVLCMSLCIGCHDTAEETGKVENYTVEDNETGSLDEAGEEVHSEQESAAEKDSQYKLLCNSEKEYEAVVSEYKAISSDIWYVIDDLNQNGRLEMIFAIRNGTALYTDFTVFEVNETFDGIHQYQFADSNTYMKDIITGEAQSDSVPDIITDTVKWTQNSENNRCEYYWTDRFRANPGEYYNGHYKVWLEENLVHQELIAYKFQNAEQDKITYYDMLGNEITEAQFDELLLPDAEQNEKALSWNLYIPEENETVPDEEKIEVEQATPLTGDWYEDENGFRRCEIYVEVGNISEEERDHFTEFFQKNGGGGFIYCDYDRPQDVDLNLVFYGAQTKEWDEKELEQTGFDYGFIEKSKIDECLMKFLRLTNEQMTKPLFVKERNGEEVVAWMCSDALNIKPVCLGGYKDGDIYTLLMDAPLSAVTLKRNGNDSVSIISNCTLDNHFYFLDGTDYDPNEKYCDTKSLSTYTRQDLELLKNEYYARHGMIFDDPVMKLYFEAMSWYKPSVEGVAFDESVFNEVEKANIAYIDELLKADRMETEADSQGDML